MATGATPLCNLNCFVYSKRLLPRQHHTQHVVFRLPPVWAQQIKLIIPKTFYRVNRTRTRQHQKSITIRKGTTARHPCGQLTEISLQTDKGEVQKQRRVCTETYAQEVVQSIPKMNKYSKILYWQLCFHRYHEGMLRPCISRSSPSPQAFRAASSSLLIVLFCFSLNVPMEPKAKSQGIFS